MNNVYRFPCKKVWSKMFTTGLDKGRIEKSALPIRNSMFPITVCHIAPQSPKFLPGKKTSMKERSICNIDICFNWNKKPGIVKI